MNTPPIPETRFFEKIVENLYEGIIIFSIDFRILYASNQIKEILSPEVLNDSNMKFYSLFDRASQKKIRNSINKLLTGESRISLEQIISINSSNVSGKLSLMLTKIETSADHVVFLAQLTDSILTNKEEELTKVLYKISEASNSSKNLKELLFFVRNELENVIDTNNFYVALYNDATEKYTFPYHKDEYDDIEENVEYDLSGSVTDYVRRNKIPLLVDDYVNSMLAKSGEIVEAVGAPSAVWIGVPLRVGKSAIGVVAVQSYDSGTDYDNEDLEILKIVSENISSVIYRKHTEDALKDSEIKFRSLFGQAPFAIQVYDKDGLLLYANPAWGKLFDIKQPEEYFGEYNILQTAKFGNDQLYAGISQVMSGETVFFDEIFLNAEKLKIDGRNRWVKKNMYPLYDLKGNISNIVIMDEDITKRKESEERYRHIFENATLGVFQSSFEGRFLIANPALIEMLGYESYEELSKVDIEKEIYANPLERKIYKNKLISEEIVSGFETVFKKRNGDYIFIRNSAKLTSDEQGNKFIEGTIEDISEKKLAERTMLEAKEKAEKSDRLKSEFLAQMSHEIRTPINTILSFSSLLKEMVTNELPDDMADSFDIMDRAGKRIIRTIDMILDMSLLQSGSYESVKKRVDIFEDILINLVADSKLKATQKNLDLKIKKNVKIQ